MNVVLFEMAGALHALPGEAVREVIDLLPATPLPFSPPYVDGLINHAGRVLLRIDLAMRLGLTQQPMAEEGALLIAQTGATLCALHIQRVVAMIPMEEEAIHWCDLSTQENGHGVRGEFHWEERTVLLLETARLGPEEMVSRTTSQEQQGNGMLGLLEEQSGVIPGATAADDCLKCLVVESLGARYALRLDEVREVVEVTTLTPFPHAPREVAGVVSLRHQPYLALTLSGLLECADQEETPVMILVEYRSIHMGLLVKRVVGIERFTADDRHPTDGQSCYHALLQTRDGRMIAHLNLDGLIDATRFERYRSYLTREHLQKASEEAQSLTRSFLSVQVGEEWCAVPLELVDRVVEYLPPDPLTGSDQAESTTSRPHMDGVAQIHGEITPVSDLRFRFQTKNRELLNAAFVVVRVENRPWALAVDRVNRVVEIPEHAISPIADQKNDWISSVGQLDGRIFSVLNVMALAGGASVG